MTDKFQSRFKPLKTANIANSVATKIDKNQVKVATEFVKNELGFEILLDIAVVDNSGLNIAKSVGTRDPLSSDADSRFSVYYLFRKLDGSFLAFWVDTDEVLDSVSAVYKSADWAEREAFDQFGIIFKNHPNLKRILNHKDFVGYPLRKDYEITKYQLLKSSDDLVDQMRIELANKGLLSGENSELGTKYTFLNIGPSHPATHGTIRNFIALDGERIRACVTEIGYLHRGFEKAAEAHSYAQIMPYTDRLNYCSALLNNFGYAKAIEEALNIKIPDRAAFMRVILGELARIIDHEVCLAAMCVDMGALTNYWYLYNPREKIYGFLSKLTGARFTNSFGRIGGVANDFFDGWQIELENHLKAVEIGLNDMLHLTQNNRIFLDRVQNICKISGEDALNYGFTGPNLRASGVAYDIRKTAPYWFYDSFDFKIPVGSVGDVYDRIFVRVEEIKQSINIIRQAAKMIPGGDYIVRDPDFALPLKSEVYNSIEGIINHFKLIFDGVKLPFGASYSASEGGNGELGFFIFSDSLTPSPYRLKLRPPCFYGLNAFSQMVDGELIADSILNLGSLNIIAGELDR